MPTILWLTIVAYKIIMLHKLKNYSAFHIQNSMLSKTAKTIDI